MKTTLTVQTGPNPGAIGLMQLHGPGILDVLVRLTGRSDWPLGRIFLVRLADLDQGLAVRIAENCAHLMPHGGPYLMRLLLERICQWGIDYEARPPTQVSYPEAASALEADALATMAEAASPAAVDLLLAQQELWSNWHPDAASRRHEAEAIGKRSDRLDRLVHPPAVVVVGQPNVGKSTLTNAILGRSASLVAGTPGTTRDWVGGLAQLQAPPHTVDGASPDRATVAVRWMDTPGLRHADDPIERDAIALAQQALAQADVLIAMRDPMTRWPKPLDMPRQADLWVLNKMDLAATVPPGNGRDPDRPLSISAARGTAIDRLGHLVLQQLELDRLDTGQRWAFSTTLRGAMASTDTASLAAYFGAGSSRCPASSGPSPTK